MITVITICWNAAPHIRGAIQSVLEQDHRPRQYLFVDGGSTDGTLDIIEQCRPELEQAGIATELIRQQRLPGEAGIPSAWNQGIARATGDIIALLNSDDRYLPGALKAVVEQWRSDTELLCGSIRLTQNGRTVGEIHPKCLCLAEILMPVPHPACFVARKLYQRIGLYDTRYAISADYDFIWRCRKAKAALAFVPQTLTEMETGGLANSNRARARRETLDIARNYTAFPPLPWLAWLLRCLTGR